MTDSDRKQLVSPRRPPALEMARNAAGAFDVDAWHAMNERDNALVEDEILHGAGSSKFVYSFEIGGKPVNGISVVGARQLAAHYGGLKHRIVASTHKIGSLFTFTSFPAEGTEMRVSAAVIQELADEEDYYSVVVETTDLKSGNSVQVEARETRFERRRDGSPFERPNYQKIAQAKARRNAILDLIPQHIQIEWKQQQLQLGKTEIITDSVIDQKRAGVLTFAARNGIPLLRDRVHALTMDQIAGLAEAAREGRQPAFAHSARGLGLLDGDMQEIGAPETGAPAPAASAPHSSEGTERQTSAKSKRGAPKEKAPEADGPAPEGAPEAGAAPAQTERAQGATNGVPPAQEPAPQKAPSAPRKLF